jgi:transcriptional regulator with GAF, ATPase, and Fis domain
MCNAGTINHSALSPDRSGWVGDDLCRPFVEQLFVTGVSISVIGTHMRRMTVCSSDSVSASLDGLQFDLGEGPQWEVMKTGTPVLSADLSPRATASWPVFGDAAARLGAAALFAFPLAMGAVTVGVINLYRTTPGALDARMVALARSLTNQVAGAAVKAAIYSAQAEDAPEAAGTATMRREVHQATGMILVQLEISATEAFSLLRGHAFASSRTMEDVATDVVARRLDFRCLPD